ncbi:hypothetical protein [Facilibium subflavum]|uniref:hypothetical protein n=1 Tax=Facilibium subflavum TaxID=2219058 RepID=UPI000E648F64|nr:hypothetical protein [Facilibium subflavum]
MPTFIDKCMQMKIGNAIQALKQEIYDNKGEITTLDQKIKIYTQDYKDLLDGSKHQTGILKTQQERFITVFATAILLELNKIPDQAFLFKKHTENADFYTTLVQAYMTNDFEDIESEFSYDYHKLCIAVSGNSTNKPYIKPTLKDKLLNINHVDTFAQITLKHIYALLEHPEMITQQYTIRNKKAYDRYILTKNESDKLNHLIRQLTTYQNDIKQLKALQEKAIATTLSLSDNDSVKDADKTMQFKAIWQNYHRNLEKANKQFIILNNAYPNKFEICSPAQDLNKVLSNIDALLSQLKASNLTLDEYQNLQDKLTDLRCMHYYLNHKGHGLRQFFDKNLNSTKQTSQAPIQYLMLIQNEKQMLYKYLKQKEALLEKDTYLYLQLSELENQYYFSGHNFKQLFTQCFAALVNDAVDSASKSIKKTLLQKQADSLKFSQDIPIEQLQKVLQLACVPRHDFNKKVKLSSTGEKLLQLLNHPEAELFRKMLIERYNFPLAQAHTPFSEKELLILMGIQDLAELRKKKYKKLKLDFINQSNLTPQDSKAYHGDLSNN